MDRSNRSVQDHPPQESLQSFSLGHLVGEASASIQAHLDDCEACRQAVAQLTMPPIASPLADTLPRMAKTATPGPGSPTVSAGGSAALAGVPAELANHPDYRILRELGRGGMGVVYLAHNTLMGRDEVLKVAHRALLDDPETGARFLQEIRSASQLVHPNVVRAYSVLRLGDLLVFAMEYVPGDDLGKIVRDRGRLAPAEACRFAMQAAQGLEHARSKGMVHRDIKPSNLIVTQDHGESVVKILDFGLAKMTSAANQATGLTGTGKMLGTPDYIAPEQIADAAEADIRADIYSLGCTLYSLLAGKAPFAGKSLFQMLHAHVSSEAKPLDELCPNLPKGLAAVVARMMAKDPANRYQTPAEAAAALAPFARGPQISGLRSSEMPTMTGAVTLPAMKARIDSPKRPSRVRWIAIAAALGLVGAVGAAVVFRDALRGPATANLPETNEKAERAVARATTTAIARPTAKQVEHLPNVGVFPKSPAPKFDSLFNGTNLTGWHVESGAKEQWTVEDRELVARSSSWETRSFLLTDDSYADYVLRFEVKFKPSTGSAVAVRAVEGERLPVNGKLMSDHPLIRLRCGGGAEDPVGSGHMLDDLTRNVPPLNYVPCKSNLWHAVELAVVGDTCTATFDGMKILDLRCNHMAADGDAKPALRRRTGRIGLQAHTGEVRFRNIEVQKLDDFAPDADESFFNGRDLSNWTGLPGYWACKQGAIVGAPANGVAVNTFLVSERSCRDFELRFKVRRTGGVGNSGLQFRSVIGNAERLSMRGPQMEIDSADAAIPPGGVFEEPTGMHRSLPADRETVARVWKNADFNAMSIRCVGKHVTTIVNGVVVVNDDTDWLPDEGRIGWQLHGTRSPREVVFKDIEFVDLSEAAAKHPGVTIRR
jgi:serine/threonine protein kinase